MTKIYLVVFKTSEKSIYDAEVFTNKNKAKQYKRYWDAKMKIEENFKGDTTEIIEKRINTLDYTEYANEKEMELLPY